MMQLVQKNVFLIALLIIIIGCISYVGINCYFKTSNSPAKLLSSKRDISLHEKAFPLLAYTIPNLANQEFVAEAPLRVEKLIAQDEIKHLYTLLFTYQSQGKTISGALNVKIDPNNPVIKKPVIIMLRGYAPSEIYYSGMGTKNAALALAEAGYLTLAPDFLGYGESDPEPSDTWEARFIKPLNVIDLLTSLEAFPELDLSTLPDAPVQKITLDPTQIGLWAHSNGGQIALTTLEILGRNLPTTLWAPVLAPFPYSILYFSDEYADEGKETRKYVALFEEDYDVFDFSLTRHLDRLKGPMQIHHGGRDDSALLSWTEEFLTKVELENERREDLQKDAESASQSATQEDNLEEIQINFYRYSNADHNLQPNWQQVMQRDLEFFGNYLLAKKSMLQ
jgi:uncharacterized protein